MGSNETVNGFVGSAGPIFVIDRIPEAIATVFRKHWQDFDYVLQIRPPDAVALWCDIESGAMGVYTMEDLPDMPEIVRKDIPTKPSPGAYETWWVDFTGIPDAGWVRYNRYILEASRGEA